MTTASKWSTGTPGVVVLSQRLQALHLRLVRVELVRKMRRAHAVIQALMPRSPLRGE